MRVPRTHLTRWTDTTLSLSLFCWIINGIDTEYMWIQKLVGISYSSFVMRERAETTWFPSHLFASSFSFPSVESHKLHFIPVSNIWNLKLDSWKQNVYRILPLPLVRYFKIFCLLITWFWFILWRFSFF